MVPDLISQIKWDNTWSPSTVISSLFLCIAIIGSAWKLVSTVNRVKDTQDEMNPHIKQIPKLADDVATMKTDIGEMKPQMMEVRVEQAKLVAQDGSLERRVSNVEARVDRLEDKK